VTQAVFYLSKRLAFSTVGIAACCARPMGTLAVRAVFSGTHMSRQKTDWVLFAAAAAKLYEVLHEYLNP